eukprot:CAMPEP_0173114602 /NCGR_PEP_ID=MMETSP1102-20130122/47779_1 /TAXON_ID=49646 /ORGANISM="Geminigera sp., Strain Caron Lab Isolate" /LENGTH=43 /DNA_ID= /DNA_START= /DNA_END= /DNA_ORIENTATION=
MRRTLNAQQDEAARSGEDACQYRTCPPSPRHHANGRFSHVPKD